MIIINLMINGYNNNNNNNNGDIFTKQTPASKLFVLTVPFLYLSYMETFFLVHTKRGRTLFHGLPCVDPKCHAE